MLPRYETRVRIAAMLGDYELVADVGSGTPRAGRRRRSITSPRCGELGKFRRRSAGASRSIWGGRIPRRSRRSCSELVDAHEHDRADELLDAFTLGLGTIWLALGLPVDSRYA